jgi:hypothetical protein
MGGRKVIGKVNRRRARSPQLESTGCAGRNETFGTLRGCPFVIGSNRRVFRGARKWPRNAMLEARGSKEITIQKVLLG